MPISTPTAIISGSAGTIAPRMMTASLKAMAKTTMPASVGCAAIHASRVSIQAFIAGL